MSYCSTPSFILCNHKIPSVHLYNNPDFIHSPYLPLPPLQFRPSYFIADVAVPVLFPSGPPYTLLPHLPPAKAQLWPHILTSIPKHPVVLYCLLGKHQIANSNRSVLHDLAPAFFLVSSPMLPSHFLTFQSNQITQLFLNCFMSLSLSLCSYCFSYWNVPAYPSFLKSKV